MPIWETWQVSNLGLSVGFTLRSGTEIVLGLNLLGIVLSVVFIALFKTPKTNSVIQLKATRKDSILEEFMPSSFRILNEVTISNKQWFLLKQESEIDNFGIISTTDAGKFKLRKGNKYIYKIVPSIDNLDELDTKELKADLVTII